jgi:hypothetical protein
MRVLDQLSIPLLIGSLVGLLLIRVLALSGHGLGGTVFLGLFWLLALLLGVKLIVGLARGRGGWEYGFLLLALLALTVSAILGKHTVGPTTFIVFVLSMIGLLVVWVGRWRRRDVKQ